MCHISLPESMGFQVQTDQSCDGRHLLASQTLFLASICDSPGRGPQRHRGLPFKDRSSRVGVFSRQGFLPVDPATGPQPTGRFIHDGVHPQTPSLCSSEPGPSGIYHRCTISRLELVAEEVSVSSSHLSLASSSQVEVFRGQSSSSGSLLPEEQLVPSPYGTSAPSILDSNSGALSGSANHDCVGFILANIKLDFMGFLQFAAERRFSIDPVNMDFTEADKSDSTLRQYDAAFKK